MNRRHAIALVCFSLLATAFPVLGREGDGSGPSFGAQGPKHEAAVYRLAVHPLHNPAKLIKSYQPLIDYLNTRLSDARLVLEASRDYANFEEKYLARKPEFILPNPWQTLQAMKVGYRVIASAGQPEDFKGIFVARKDSPLRQPGDLKGKAVSYPAPTALAACMMPQFFLHDHGINVNADIQNHYVGSQESSIMNAYLGKTAVAATWPPPWRAFQKDHPSEAAEMYVIWETAPLINNSVMVRDDVAAGLAERVRTLLVELGGTAEGKAILANMETARFQRANDGDYDVVRRYVARFEKEVRPVEQR
jgi:phosphonate transport system substrate-binding protein